MTNRTITRPGLGAGEVAPGVQLRVFVSAEQGARGVSTGTATFRPGAELPYHTHPFSEVITVLSGQAHIYVEGRRYRLAPFDAIHVPAATPHLVRNASSDSAAILLWTFASETPVRELVADTFAVVDRSETDATTPEHLTRFTQAADAAATPPEKCQQ
jgi:quercetin dioxygenase-like cupin family protein